MPHPVRGVCLPMFLAFTILLAGCAHRGDVCFQPQPGSGRILTILDQSEFCSLSTDPDSTERSDESGHPEPSNLWFRMNWVIEVEAGKRNPDGSTSLSVTYHKADATQGASDSTTPGASSPSLGPIQDYRPLEGKTFTMNQHTDGTLSDVQGHDVIYDALMAANPVPDQLHELMANLYSDKGAANLWTDVLALRVQGPLVKGESWTRDLPVMPAPNTHTCTYTVRRISHKTVWLDLAFETHLYAGATPIASGTGTGTMVIDRNAGWVRKAYMNIFLTSEMAGTSQRSIASSQRSIRSRSR